jgi:very-short-patch-repair endonuclease
VSFAKTFQDFLLQGFYHMPSLTPDDFKNLAEKRGFAWVGEFPKITPSSVNTLWRCPLGHTWKAKYKAVKGGTGCPICYAKRRDELFVQRLVRVTLQDYQAVAETLNLTLIGSIPNLANEKSLWRCNKGHEFMSSYAHLRDAIKATKGDGCDECRREKIKATISHTTADYHNLAKARNLTWVGSEVIGVNALTTWRCHQGHEFEAKYFNIQQNSWRCPYCPTERGKDKTIGDYQALAVKGFTWIGETFVATHHYTRWRCGNGHEFNQTYSNLAREICKCPLCDGDRENGVAVSKAQRAIHAMLGGEINYRLKSRTGRYTIDIALDVDKLFPIAIEYDSSYFHNPEHDAKRDEWLAAHGWYIVHIKADQKIPTKAQLDAAIKRIYQGERIVEIWLDWRGRKRIGT